MTLHGAKGLEFPVVFMTGMEEGVFPSYLCSETPAESGRTKIVLCGHNQGDGTALSDQCGEQTALWL